MGALRAAERRVSSTASCSRPRPLGRIGITPESMSVAGGKPVIFEPDVMPLAVMSMDRSYPYYTTRRSPGASPFSPLPGGLQVLFDLLELGVAHILAVHEVDQVFADVLGMIADPLQRTHHPHDVECAANRARILHHEGDVLAVDRLVFLIDRAVPRSEEHT